jgi:hypothetical protein
MVVLAFGGAAGFWLVNLAISLTPLAAEYRAALSIAYLPMLLEAFLGGLIVGLCVSFCLLRFFDRIPGNSPMGKSLLLAAIGFVVATLALEVPAKFMAGLSDPVRYFLMSVAINGLRFLALGVVIGYLYGRLDDRTT